MQSKQGTTVWGPSAAWETSWLILQFWQCPPSQFPALTCKCQLLDFKILWKWSVAKLASNKVMVVVLWPGVLISVRLTIADIIFQFLCDEDMLTYGWTTSAVVLFSVVYLDWAAGVGLDHIVSPLFDFGFHGELLLQGSESTGSRWRHLVPLTQFGKLLIFLHRTCTHASHMVALASDMFRKTEKFVEEEKKKKDFGTTSTLTSAKQNCHLK